MVSTIQRRVTAPCPCKTAVDTITTGSWGKIWTAGQTNCFNW